MHEPPGWTNPPKGTLTNPQGLGLSSPKTAEGDPEINVGNVNMEILFFQIDGGFYGRPRDGCAVTDAQGLPASSPEL